jgi:hypothetical protein
MLWGHKARLCQLSQKGDALTPRRWVRRFFVRSGVDMLGDIEQPVRPLRDDNPGRGQMRAACGTDRKPHAGLRLDRCEPCQHRLLRQSEFPARRAAAAHLATAKTTSSADSGGIRQ